MRNVWRDLPGALEGARSSCIYATCHGAEAYPQLTYATRGKAKWSYSSVWHWGCRDLQRLTFHRKQIMAEGKKGDQSVSLSGDAGWPCEALCVAAVFN